MEYSVEGESISNIADAIRERSGSEDPMTLSQMPGLIRNLPGGGGEGHKVTISFDSSTHQYSADADYATISGWLNNNEYVYAEYNDGIYIPNYYSDSAIYFTRTNQSVGSNSSLDFQIFEIRVQGGPLGLNTRAIPRMYNPTSSNVGKYLKSVEVSSGIYAYEPSDLEFTITNGYSLSEHNGYYRLPSDITVATIANRLKNGEFVFCYVYSSGSFNRIYIPWQASSSGNLTLYGVVNTVSGYPAYIEVLYGSAGNGFFSVNKKYSIPLKPSSNDAGKTIIVDSDGDPRWQNLPEKEQVISYADYMALTDAQKNNGKSYYIYDAQNEGRGILMKNGVNYTGFGAKNIAIAHYDSIGIPQVFFSDKAGNKINGAPSGQSRYLTTITSDPIAFFKWDHASLGYYSFGYGAISLRPLENEVDYSTYDVHSSLSLQETFVINGVTVYVYMEIDTWHETGLYVTINDTYNITTNYVTDDDITANSKFIKDIVATLSDK